MNYQLYYIIGLISVAAFLGSWHCTVMCGPIALALSRKGDIRLFHLGRGVSYIAAGAASGTIGSELFQVTSPAAKLAAGLVLSSFFIVQMGPALGLKQFGHRLLGRVAAQKPNLFVFGLASVLLPCGWLWTFLAASAATASPWAGAIVTGALWVTTLPALSIFNQYFRTSLVGQSPRRIRWVNGILSIAGIYAIFSHFFF